MKPSEKRPREPVNARNLHTFLLRYGQKIKFLRGFYEGYTAVIIGKDERIEGSPGYRYFATYIKFKIMKDEAGLAVIPVEDELPYLEVRRLICDHDFVEKRSGFWVFGKTEMRCRNCGARRAL